MVRTSLLIIRERLEQDPCSVSAIFWGILDLLGQISLNGTLHDGGKWGSKLTARAQASELASLL